MGHYLEGAEKAAGTSVGRLSDLKRPCLTVQKIKNIAAEVLGSKSKQMQIVFKKNGEIAHSFRYLDESDYKQFPQLRGVFNAVVVPTEGAPFMQIFIELGQR
ncbi:hypothetical protein ACS8E9_18745 [Pseudomonas neustonica]|uniref:hypothetical protein n=1 Tax=Pseudomonas neustonica TaxID=2487346 RepID=UPI003F47EDEA|tara:strand:+ start:12200 stop:12505 length:306 start_codon:yes stop_codon:yes gene_type:complete